MQSAICTHRSIHEQALQLLKASSSVAAADEAAEVASLSLRLPGRVSSAHTPSVRPPRHARPAASGRQLGRTTPTQLLAIDHAFTSGPPSRTKLHAARRPRPAWMRRSYPPPQRQRVCSPASTTRAVASRQLCTLNHGLLYGSAILLCCSIIGYSIYRDP